MSTHTTYQPAFHLAGFVIATYNETIARAVVDYLLSLPELKDRCGMVLVKNQAIHWYVADDCIEKAFYGSQCEHAA